MLVKALAIELGYKMFSLDSPRTDPDRLYTVHCVVKYGYLVTLRHEIDLLLV